MAGSGDIGRTETGLDIEGTRNNDIAQSLLPKGTATAGRSSPTGIPVPGIPFKVADVVILRKGRIREEFQAVLPDNSKKLTTIIVPTALRDTDAHYQASMITDTVKIDQDLLAQNAGLVLYLFIPLVESNTQYDLVQLAVEADSADGGTGSVSNPETLPAFNAAPLAQFTSGNVVGGPGDPAINLIVINRLDPLTKKYDAEMAFRVHAPLNAAGAAQSWQTFFGAVVSAVVDFGAGQEHVQYVIGPTDTLIDPASPGVPNRGYVDIPRKKLTPGQPGTWVKNIVNLNGEKATGNSTNIGFFAGNINQTVQNLTSVNLVIQSGDPNDAKHRKLYLEFRQGTPNAVAIKAATVELKVQGDPDANYKEVVHKFPLWEDDLHIPNQLYTAANGLAPVIDNALKMKPGVAYTLRLTLKTIGDQIYYAVLPSTLPTFNVGAGNDPDVAVDTDVPTLATNPVTGTTGPTVREKLSTIHYVAVRPSANTNTLDDYQAVLCSASAAPAGDPTVGSENVLAITYGQHGHFDIALTASLTADFYFFIRAHNKSGVSHAPASAGWSAWSAGTNQHGYSNPVQAVIGGSVPVWSQRLIRANTGANVVNTTTKYYLDAGATSTTNFYLGSGTGPTALQNEIHVPSLAAADRVRQITGSGQDGTGIFVTVSPAWSGAPAGNVAFEIHGGLAIGGKSGTGHGTTSFILDHAADANVSTTSHDYDGMSLYLPPVTAGQEAQKITNSIYNGGTQLMTLTIEPAAGWAALGGAPANNTAYMICTGGFGYSGSDLTGTIKPVPFRTWQDTSDAASVQTVVEFQLPSGENAFDLCALQVQIIKHVAEVLRYDDKIPPSTTTTYRQAAFSTRFGSIRARIRNLNRDTAAKGWGDWSVYGISNKASETPTVYTPATFVPVDTDNLGPDSYPDSRYPLY